MKELTERTDQFSTDEEYVYVTCDDQGIVPPDDADWKLYTSTSRMVHPSFNICIISWSNKIDMYCQPMPNIFKFISLG